MHKVIAKLAKCIKYQVYKVGTTMNIRLSRFLTIIPARGGSKGLPGKNIRKLSGKPLICHAIEAAFSSGLQPIITTDDNEIATVASDSGGVVPFLRPTHLATDTTPMIDVLLHAIEYLSESAAYDSVLLLQPTSSLRTSGDISEALQLYEKYGDPVVSVCATAKPIQWVFFRDETGRLTPTVESQPNVPNRQEAMPQVELNGAIYIAPISLLREKRTFLLPNTRSYLMPRERSIDIDTELDWIFTEAILSRSSTSDIKKPLGK